MQNADSAEVARASRDDLARHSGMISPTSPISSRSGVRVILAGVFCGID
jgi:hypothetical protein